MTIWPGWHQPVDFFSFTRWMVQHLGILVGYILGSLRVSVRFAGIIDWWY